jgi:hypothetical protein
MAPCDSKGGRGRARPVSKGRFNGATLKLDGMSTIG